MIRLFSFLIFENMAFFVFFYLIMFFITVYCVIVDRELNDNGYIMSGLGDGEIEFRELNN